jgi:hypothetical protein
VLDPSGRQQVISCGVAAAFAAVALRGPTRWLSDPADEDHLATITVTGTHEPAEADRHLAAAIDQRHTVRTAFEPRGVPAGVRSPRRSPRRWTGRPPATGCGSGSRSSAIRRCCCAWATRRPGDSVGHRPPAGRGRLTVAPGG